MTDKQDDSNPASPETGKQRTETSGSGRKGLSFRKYFKYLLAGGIGAVVGATAFGLGAHGGHGGRFAKNPERVSRFVDHRIDRVMDRLDATDAQRAQVKDALLPASEDLRRLYLEMRDSRGQLLAALTGPDVDRIALESIRTERLDRLDDSSRRVAAALADAAVALTPEQRQQIAERMQRRARGE